MRIHRAFAFGMIIGPAFVTNLAAADASVAQPATAAAEAPGPLPDLKTFIGLDPVPVPMTQADYTRCGSWSTAPGHGIPELQAHDPCIKVSADPAAAAALRNGTALPIGSVIVKAKYRSRQDGTAVLFTVMIKHEAGYAPGVGDFAFGVIDGTGTNWIPSDVKSCIECHEGFAARGYLARDYRAQPIHATGFPAP